MDIITLLRSFRIGPVAIFDFAASYLVAYLVGPYLKKIGIPVTREQLLWWTLPLSILAHIAVGRITPLTELLLAQNEGYFVKALILGMIIIGFARREK
jgi:hypothetical protein